MPWCGVGDRTETEGVSAEVEEVLAKFLQADLGNRVGNHGMLNGLLVIQAVALYRAFDFRKGNRAF